jgi:hypothetical protein
MVSIKKLYNDSTHQNSIHDELKGTLSVTLKGGKSLDEFCKNNFENYDTERFEAVAIRVYYGKETIITLYALDKRRQEKSTYNLNKVPVKKFKKGIINISDFIEFVEEFNFTLNAGNYPIEDMEVINK